MPFESTNIQVVMDWCQTTIGAVVDARIYIYIFKNKYYYEVTRVFNRKFCLRK